MKNQQKKSILIIEDDLDVLSAFVKYFKHLGYEVIIATDGMEGLKKTPHAMISRAVVGTRGQSLIINLPGSPKAVKENLLALLPALSHTIAKIKGDDAECARS